MWNGNKFFQKLDIAMKPCRISMTSEAEMTPELSESRLAGVCLTWYQKYWWEMRENEAFWCVVWFGIVAWCVIYQSIYLSPIVFLYPLPTQPLQWRSKWTLLTPPQFSKIFIKQKKITLTAQLYAKFSEFRKNPLHNKTWDHRLVNSVLQRNAYACQ